MSDPVEFLLSKLAKVEKQARGQWTSKDDIRCPNCTPNHVSGWKSRHATRGRTVFTLEPCGCQVSRGVVMERTPDEEMLRLVAGTRLLLELHREGQRGYCGGCFNADGVPCRTLKVTALAWGWPGE